MESTIEPAVSSATEILSMCDANVAKIVKFESCNKHREVSAPSLSKYVPKTEY
jgi:hypothetical protein